MTSKPKRFISLLNVTNVFPSAKERNFSISISPLSLNSFTQKSIYLLKIEELNTGYRI